MLSWIRRILARRMAGPAKPAAKLSEPEIASAVLAGAWLASRDDEEEREALDEFQPEDEGEECDPDAELEGAGTECLETEDLDLEWL